MGDLAKVHIETAEATVTIEWPVDLPERLGAICDRAMQMHRDLTASPAPKLTAGVGFSAERSEQ